MKEKRELCREIAELNNKCNLILELFENLLGDPDFLIDRLKKAVENEKQRTQYNPEPFKVIRGSNGLE